MESVNRVKGSTFILLSHIILIVFCILCLLPFVIVLSTSLSAESHIINKGYSIIPTHFDISSYQFIFLNAKKLLNAYYITFVVTIIGTIIGLLVNAMIAYPISRKDFKPRNKITFIVFFTMMFSGGLVPWYMVINSLNLQNTAWVLIAPYLIAAWYILLLRTFFQTIPYEIIESAKIDGSSELGIFFRMILPLSKPALATVGLLIAIQYWNDYWLGLLFITEDRLISIQYLFYKISSNIDFYTKNAHFLPSGITADTLPKQSARMALCVLIVVPMLVVFPFFQKYFVSGLTVGSVKG